MPSWSPNDADIAFVSTRDGEHHVWAVPAARRRGAPGRDVGRPRRRAVVGPGRPDRAARARGPARAGWSWTARRSPAPRTPSRSVRAGPRPPSSSTPPTARSGAARSARRASPTCPSPPRCRRRRRATRRAARNFDSRDAAQGARRGAAGDLARWHQGGVRGGRRHLGDAGRRGRREPHQGSLPRHRSGVVARRHAGWSTRPTRAAQLLQLWIRDLATGQDRQLTRLDDPAAGRRLVARRHAHRVLRRRRHVAPGAGLGGGRRHRCGHADPRVAVLARQSHLVARRRARGRRHGGVRTRRASARAPTRC